MRKPNLILSTDSYKQSHFMQYPEGLQSMYSYIESRGGVYPKTLFFGLQAFVKEYLSKPVTYKDLYEAKQLVESHGLPFNEQGWKYIIDNHHGGYLPVRIRAVKEGTVVPIQNVLVTIESTDEEVPWIVGHLETILLRAIWYPTTVATRSQTIKWIIKKFLDRTSDITDPMVKLNWSLHDFGMRGVSSRESAGIAGAAHLINFMGTDTLDAIDWIKEYYTASTLGETTESYMPGFSIPASEHSVATMYGRDAGELEYVRQELKAFGKPGALFAIVADSYNVFNFCKNVLPEIKEDLIASGAMMVVRPDSGIPNEIVPEVLDILADKFGTTVNAKGYKVLNNVRVIQGDGITEATIASILEIMQIKGYSAENIAFGCGGYLLQALNRDTQKFACKCSAAKINDKWVDVTKDPVTDYGKRSKPGRITLYKNNDGVHYTSINTHSFEHEDQLETVYENGKMYRHQTFDEIRQLSEME